MEETDAEIREKSPWADAVIGEAWFVPEASNTEM
jgi:hypothetical protein